MTNIIITHISISYFKGIRNLELDFNDTITNIYGRNGIGKTSIADAVQWCLFGKNSKGESKFSIKTLDTSGNVIPNVEHSVTLSLVINGTSRDIKRQWVEKRKVVRGRETDEIEHHSEFYIDGEKFTAKDFDAFIANIISEGVFRAVTNPAYFLNLKWQEQREFLQRMAGNIDMTSLTANPRYSFLHEGQFNDIADYLQHLRYNIRQVKEKIDQIPIRIEEVQRQTPEQQDWNAIETHIAELSKQLDTAKHDLYQLKNGSAEDVARKALRDKITFNQKRIDTMQESALRMATETANKTYEEKSKLQQQLLTEKQNTDALRQKISSINLMVIRLEETLSSLKAEKLQLHADFDALKEKKKNFRITEEELSCPTCGRPFDEDKRAEAIETIRQNFLNTYELAKNKIKAKNDKINEDIASAEAQIKTYRDTIPSEEEITAGNNRILELQSRILELPVPKTANELLSINPSYKQAVEENQHLQAQLDDDVFTDNTEVITNVKNNIANLELALNMQNSLLHNKDIYNSCQQRILSLNNDLDNLRSQLDSLQQREDIAIEYQFAENELVENAVNSHFHYVRFQLFDTLNDGTRKPNCIPLINGIPYSDANSASKINAGLDVISALCNYYNVSAPITVDNAESVNTLLATSGQQIRLHVSLDDKLRIE